MRFSNLLKHIYKRVSNGRFIIAYCLFSVRKTNTIRVENFTKSLTLKLTFIVFVSKQVLEMKKLKGIVVKMLIFFQHKNYTEIQESLWCLRLEIDLSSSLSSEKIQPKRNHLVNVFLMNLFFLLLYKVNKFE